MEKILTIVIPTYNMQDYLRRCLDSLIVPKEQMKQLEVLVINDGSKDNSSAIAHEYQDKYPDTFRVIDKENGNYGSCVNRGLKEATGKYIKILDADDWFDTQNFNEYMKFLCITDADLIVNDFCMVNKEGHIIRKCFYGLPKMDVFNEKIRKVFNRKNLQMHGVAYKLKNILDMNYTQTEGISYTDQEWIYTPLMNVNTVASFDKIVYQYLIGRAGQTMSPATLKKGVLQNQQCVLAIMRSYVKSRNIQNQFISFYLYDQAIVSLRTVYSSYLLKYKDIDIEGLKDFDTQLKLIDSKLLKMADKITIPYTCFHFIKKWHECHEYNETIINNLAYLYSRIIDKFKRYLREITCW